MKKINLVTPENKTFVFNVPDNARIDSRGFYKIDKDWIKDNHEIDFQYLSHDLKHRGLNYEDSYYERNGIRLPDIKYHAQLLREPLKLKSDDWQETAHHWRVMFNDQAFDYFTGRAHRDVKKTSYNVRLTEAGLNSLLNCSIAKKPGLEDVLYSLVMDSSACDESFDDWCAGLGYDEDSREALKIYLQCQENSVKLRKAGIYIDDSLRQYFEDY